MTAVQTEPTTSLPVTDLTARREGPTLALDRLLHVMEDLGRLSTVDQLVDAAPLALCRVGFDRAMVSRVENAHWVVERFHSEVDADNGSAITEMARREPHPLTPAVIELEMIRRRVPLLVADVTRENRLHRVLVDLTESQAYVAAPIISDDRVIGFLHADRVSGSTVTTFDRDLVALFAQQFAGLVRNAYLNEQFNRLRKTVDHLTTSLGGMVDRCVDDVTSLAPAPAPSADPQSAPAATSGSHALAASLMAGTPEIEELLSAREREVLRFMAMGETNTRIASRLVISEGTVKSHVRAILRKLSASNRAEAVCRWLARPQVATR